MFFFCFFFSSRRRHTRYWRDWSSDVCSSDLDEDRAKQLQAITHGPSFRPYTSVDVLGCEIGGAYKNVVGLAVGMAVGLGFGDNTTASVITRGLAETARLATAQ